TVTFRVDVASPYAAPLPDTQVNNASGYGEWNDFKFHPTDFDYMQVGAFPQLDIVKTSDPSGAVKLGDTLDYQIVVENTGAVAQTGLVLTDTLPTGVTYIAQSTIATGPAGSEKRVRDEFSTRSY